MVLESNFTTTDIDARALFQGGDITTRSVKDSHGRLSSLHLATRDNGGGQEEVQLTRTLTALETMSVLHHKATGGQHRSPQWIVYPATSTQKQCRTTAINMLLFTGDSIGRQFFRRLVDVLRRSSLGGQVSVPYGSTFVNTSFRHWPSKDYTDWQDMVLAIYPTHDELHVFDSLMSFSTVAAGSPYERTSNTVNAFFENAVAQRRRHRCGDDGESNGPTSASNNLQGQEEPIFYLVHLFDAITSRPRTDGLAPCLPLPPLSDFPLPGTNSFSLLKRAATLGMNLIPDPPIRPFRALGIRIPLHVHNSNMWERDESATTSDWLTKMAVNCSVEAPNVSLASAVPEKKGIRWLADGDDWTVGVHPSSDITHLYRVSTQLRHTEASMRRLRVSPHGHYKQIAARQDDVVFLPTHSSLTRLATPFLWLRNTTAAMRETQQRRRCGSSQPQGGVFFSQVRVLDMGKMMLASGNVFHTPDRLHENCIGGVNWLEGAASYNASARPILGQWSRDITKLALALIKERANVAGYDSNFAFEPDSGCGALGTLETINALLLDIVDSCRGM
ncbi:Hypothetical protein, putative [Bodo saltans]|uniref:Uncharacterized protein n=1 Tax=Bodo saltans TaxID=75058 RepID=A0A0S4JJ37_BODSA|nr:Hypothetical protein, putative [Bodo saltans]|eukprot:CUG91563.1 Hypothetical protein, putative [Bodo saltans]